MFYENLKLIVFIIISLIVLFFSNKTLKDLAFNDDTDSDQAMSKALGKVRFWRMIAFAVVVGILLYLLSQAFFLTKSSTGGLGAPPLLEKVNKQYGICRQTKPLFANGKPDTNYIRLEVSLTGKDCGFREFELNNLEYASGPGCFRTSPDQTTQSMVNYIPQKWIDSLASFYTTIKSTSNDSPFQFSIKLFDGNDKLIGMFPETGDTYKGTVVFIKYPVLIAQNVKLNR